jgi:di/tripeptidase
LFGRHNNLFSFQGLPIPGAFVYRHGECVHTEIERVELK